MIEQTSRLLGCWITIICSLYVIILFFFRLSVKEVNSLTTGILEISLSGIIALAGWNTDILPSHLQDLVLVCVSLTALYFAYRMNRMHVAGIKYIEVRLDGNVYIVTGSNTGIGYETARSIVAMGGTVVLACRSVDRAKEAKERILSSTRCSSTKVHVLKLDLCGFDSVRKFVKEFKALNIPLHCLINNAGVMMQVRNLTQDGFEMVFTANHLSHFLLTNLLLPELEKTAGRIVNVTSSLHKTVDKFNFDDVMSERSYR